MTKRTANPKPSRKFKRVPVCTHYVMVQVHTLTGGGGQHIQVYGSGYSNRGALLDALPLVLDMLEPDK